MGLLFIIKIDLNNIIVNAQIFNAAFENLTLVELAQIVKEVVGNHVYLEKTLGNDRRSYKVSSSKLVEYLKVALS